MTGDDFVELAIRLSSLDTTPTDAILRTAVSRAYYGAFHLVRNFLTEMGLAVGRDHGLPARLLLASGEKNAREAGKRLTDLQSDRVKADYDLVTSRFNQVALVQERIQDALEIRTYLAICAQEPTRSAVKAGIEAYQRRITGQP